MDGHGFKEPKQATPPPPHGPLQLSGAFHIDLSREPKRHVQDRDFHTAFKEWIGTARSVHGKAGNLFNKGVQKGESAALYKSFPNVYKADTRPAKDSPKPSRDATPPNPGRPQFGLAPWNKRTGLA